MNRTHGITLDTSAVADLDWLIVRGVRVTDHRDAIGAERIRGGAEKRLGIGRLNMPVSTSGHCTRQAPESASRMLGRMLSEARRIMSEWLDAPIAPSGRGGSCKYRPVAVVIDNFGVAVYALESTRRVQPL
jgi:hypothetical protein